MVRRLSADVRTVVLTSATEEARRRGDRRLGTDHLLLGLLHDADSPATRALGVDLAAARAASDALDLAALAAVGVNVARLGDPPQPVRARGRLSLTSGARAVFVHAVEDARRGRTQSIDARHFLLALLDRERPDPAAELLEALGVDRSQVRRRLDGPSE
jgi:ATP-dependent Clp protease ATP-binding subunit ClpA